MYRAISDEDTYATFVFSSTMAVILVSFRNVYYGFRSIAVNITGVVRISLQ